MLNFHFKFAFLFILGVVCALPLSSISLAEELEPRRWTHLPINTNFVGGGFAHTDADISFDPVLKIEDGQVDLHTWLAKYIAT
jgi:hypothetical protein